MTWDVETWVGSELNVTLSRLAGRESEEQASSKSGSSDRFCVDQVSGDLLGKVKAGDILCSKTDDLDETDATKVTSGAARKDVVRFKREYTFALGMPGYALPELEAAANAYQIAECVGRETIQSKFGLHLGDEVVAVNGMRVGTDFMQIGGSLENMVRSSRGTAIIHIHCRSTPTPGASGANSSTDVAGAATPSRTMSSSSMSTVDSRASSRKRGTATLDRTPSLMSVDENSQDSANGNNSNNNVDAEHRDKRQMQENDLDLGPDGLSIGEHVIPLTCPVTLKKLERPARGRDCTHPTAVELLFCKPGGKCPICSKQVNSVYIDVELMNAILAAPPSCEKLKVTQHGNKFSFSPADKERTTAVHQLLDDEIEDDDDDDENMERKKDENTKQDSLVKSILHGVPDKAPDVGDKAPTTSSIFAGAAAALAKGASSLAAGGSSVVNSFIASLAGTNDENLIAAVAAAQAANAAHAAQNAAHAAQNAQPAVKREPSNSGAGGAVKLEYETRKEDNDAAMDHAMANIMAQINNMSSIDIMDSMRGDDVGLVEKLTRTLTLLSQRDAFDSCKELNIKPNPKISWAPCRIVMSKSKKKLFIGGIEIHFPHRKPLVPQTRLMVEMIQCLKNQQHALLESPTGTGKTAAAACAALAWQRHNDMQCWKDYGGYPRTIYYLTRTHSQAAQIVSALRDMPYRPMLVTLASRSNLCANKEVLYNAEAGNEGLSSQCVQAIKGGSCTHYRNMSSQNFIDGLYRLTRSKGSHESSGLYDIEDMRKFGSSNTTLGCPFYATKALHPSSQFVICPYNYVIDPEIRAIVIPETGVRDSVFIFDEGHNLESACLDTGSCTLTLADLFDVVKDLCVVASFHNWIVEGTINVREIAYDVMAVFDRLAEFLLRQREAWEHQAIVDRVPAFEQRREIYRRGGIASTAKTPLSTLLFKDSDISMQLIDTASNSLTLILKALSELKHVDPNDPSTHDSRPRFLRSLSVTAKKVLRVMKLMQKVPQDFYAVINAERCEPNTDLVHNFHRDFNEPMHRPARMCAQRHGTYLNRKQQDTFSEWKVELSLLLMNPGVVFNDISEISHSVLVASGTLYPMNPSELGESFVSRMRTKDRQIALDHVIDLEKQLFLGVVSRSPKNEVLDGSYKNRQKLGPFRYEAALVETIRVLVRDAVSVQGGSIVFLSSFKQLIEVQKYIKKNRLNGVLTQERGPLIFENGNAKNDSDHFFDDEDDDEEDNGSLDEWGLPAAKKMSPFELAKSQFRTAVDNGQSPILFAVFRGKMSEGIDFKDNYCRAVFLVGIPFPALFDSGIKYKRAWNDSKHAESSSYLTGQEWYTQQAFRALNQALGRVIRHKNDYGAVFMIDSRLEDGSLQRFLARWCRKAIKATAFPNVIADVRKFFASVPSEVLSGATANQMDLEEMPASQASHVSTGSAV